MNLMVRFPNFLHTYVDTLAGGADLAGGLSVSHRRSLLEHARLLLRPMRDGTAERQLDHRASVRNAAHDLADCLPASAFRAKPTATIWCSLLVSNRLHHRRKSRSSRTFPSRGTASLTRTTGCTSAFPGSFSHANTSSDSLDFSGPLLALGFYDTQAAHLDLAGNECILNGVAGTPIGISSISENGTTVTVATAAPHGLTSGGIAAIAQLHSPLAAAAYDNSNFGPITVTDSTHFTFTAMAAGLPSDTNDGVVGHACAGGQGFIGDVARNARLDLYLNYFLGYRRPTADRSTWQRTPGGAWRRHPANRCGQFRVLSVEGQRPGADRQRAVSRSRQKPAAIAPANPSAKPACTGKTDPLSNSTWNVAGYCGPNNSTLGRPAYYPGNICAPIFFDDLDHRLGGEGKNPPGLGSASNDRADRRSEFLRNVCA